jgi:hypothetical protein
MKRPQLPRPHYFDGWGRRITKPDPEGVHEFPWPEFRLFLVAFALPLVIVLVIA